MQDHLHPHPQQLLGEHDRSVHERCVQVSGQLNPNPLGFSSVQSWGKFRTVSPHSLSIKALNWSWQYFARALSVPRFTQQKNQQYWHQRSHPLSLPPCSER